jgi:nitrile hydratase subunit beta
VAALAPAYQAGARVRVRPGDPDHHTRVPRYVRGQVGEVVAAVADWALPDETVRGVTRVETCYAVRFTAAELWGSGDHAVLVDLWESYLELA